MTPEGRILEAWESYRRDKGLLEEVRIQLTNKLRAALGSRRISARIFSRVKKVDSLIKKLLDKTYHTYDSLPDKVGAQVILRSAGQIDNVVTLLKEQFDDCPIDDKRRDNNALGYRGIHLDVCVSGVRCEVQIRTFAHHAWCEASHAYDYKGAVEISTEISRHLSLLS